jgi:hypothetical protein
MIIKQKYPTLPQHKKYICNRSNIENKTTKKSAGHLDGEKHFTTTLPQIYSFICDKCNFKTNNKKDYNRHLQSKKHNIDSNLILENKIFRCECGKEYPYRSSLYNHKKICKEKNKNEVKELNEEIDYKNVILQVLNQNKDLQDLLIKQQEEFINQQKFFIKNQEEHEKKYENLVLNLNSNNNTIIKNNNNKTFNTNTQYNVMMFLNEKCKDAMTIQEFADRLVVSIDDLEKKKIDCLTNTILKNLKSLKITERPVHCGNAKRKEWYLNHKDTGWIMDNGEKFIKTAEYGINKKYKAEFISHYPNYETQEQIQDKYTSLLYRIFTDLPEHEQSKLLNVVAKDLMIDFYE